MRGSNSQVLEERDQKVFAIDHVSTGVDLIHKVPENHVETVTIRKLQLAVIQKAEPEAITTALEDLRDVI